MQFYLLLLSLYPFHRGSEEVAEAQEEEEEAVLEGEVVLEGEAVFVVDIITVEIIMVGGLPHVMRVVWEILYVYKIASNKVDQLALLLAVSLGLAACAD